MTLSSLENSSKIFFAFFSGVVHAKSNSMHNVLHHNFFIVFFLDYPSFQTGKFIKEEKRGNY